MRQIAERTREVPIDFVIGTAKAGGEVLLKYFREGLYQTSTKVDTSLQTTADLAAEKAILDRIRKDYPEHSIDSEEFGILHNAASEYQWLIDPLDGTENFVLGIPYFSSSITLCKNGEPFIAVVYNPITRETYAAQKGKGSWLNEEPLHISDRVQLRGSRGFFIPDFVTKKQSKTTCFRDRLYMQCRRLLDTWSPALDWCLVASGKVDLVVALAGQTITPDAGTLILQESGGFITDFTGKPFSRDNNGCIVGSSSESLHEQLLRFIKDSYTDDCGE